MENGWWEGMERSSVSRELPLPWQLRESEGGSKRSFCWSKINISWESIISGGRGYGFRVALLLLCWGSPEEDSVRRKDCELWFGYENCGYFWAIPEEILSWAWGSRAWTELPNRSWIRELCVCSWKWKSRKWVISSQEKVWSKKKGRLKPALLLEKKKVNAASNERKNGQPGDQVGETKGVPPPECQRSECVKRKGEVGVESLWGFKESDHWKISFKFGGWRSVQGQLRWRERWGRSQMMQGKEREEMGTALFRHLV